jgi:hypothetical protein
MADIALTATQVTAVDPEKAEIHDFLAAEALTRGQAVYMTTTGTVGIADGNASGKTALAGVALRAAAAGQPVPVLKSGAVYGYTVAALNVGTGIYLSDTAGALADAQATITTIYGRVIALTDSSKTKVVYLDVIWN